MLYLTGSSRKGLPGHFAYLASPANGGKAMLREGRPWAGDCGAFTESYSESMYFMWLEKMRAYRNTCLFVVVPDVVFRAKETLIQFRRYAERIRAMGFPIALVAQNGLRPYEDGVCCDDVAGYTDWCKENEIDFDSDDPAAWWESVKFWKQTHVEWEEFDVLFIGGDIPWKLSEEALSLISEAKRAHKRVHVGRVNTGRRLRHFQLAGVDTVDGNALKYFDSNFPILNKTLSQLTLFEVLFEEDQKAPIKQAQLVELVAPSLTRIDKPREMKLPHSIALFE
jgi:hypothetical protein